MATNNPATRSRRGVSASGFQEYLRGVREELLKAKWPTKTELYQLTQVTLALIAVVAAYCGGLDFLLGLITNRLFNRQ